MVRMLAKSKWDDDSLILQGQIIKVKDVYFILSPVECMFIPTSESINKVDGYKDGVLLDHGKTPVDLNFYFRKI